ncbi:MAG TPA: DUF6370 family protein [Daejeonella sp.]|nr:DUF6370 family protein [Daejeonella sp.]
MKLYLVLFTLLFSATISSAQQKPAVKKSGQIVLSNQTVEASCGQCQFNMEGKSCDLAVRIDGKAYFVDGTEIDDHGDAHAKDGFCQKVRKAVVSGQVVDNRFKATSFKLLAEEKNSEKGKL